MSKDMFSEIGGIFEQAMFKAEVSPPSGCELSPPSGCEVSPPSGCEAAPPCCCDEFNPEDLADITYIRRLSFYEYSLLVSLLKFRDAYLRLVDDYLDVVIDDDSLLHALEAAYPDDWPSFTCLPIPEWVEDTLENCG